MCLSQDGGKQQLATPLTTSTCLTYHLSLLFFILFFGRKSTAAIMSFIARFLVWLRLNESSYSCRLTWWTSEISAMEILAIKPEDVCFLPTSLVHCLRISHNSFTLLLAYLRFPWLIAPCFSPPFLSTGVAKPGIVQKLQHQICSVSLSMLLFFLFFFTFCFMLLLSRARGSNDIFI